MAKKKTTLTRTVRTTKAGRARKKRLQTAVQKKNAALVKALESADLKCANALKPAELRAKALTEARALFEKRTDVGLSLNSPEDVLERLDSTISEAIADALDELRDLNQEIEA